ncbi:MAG: hypothetical protein ACLQNV_07315 [Steroidobacteraceae bacterium]
MRKIFPALIAGVAIAMAAGPASATSTCPPPVTLTIGSEVSDSYAVGSCYDFSFMVPAGDTVALDFAFGAAAGDVFNVNVQYGPSAPNGYNETASYTPGTSDSWGANFNTPGPWDVYVTLTTGAADPYGGVEITTNLDLSLPIPTRLTATPLPSTWTMLIAGFVGLGFFAYRGTKKVSAGLATA